MSWDPPPRPAWVDDLLAEVDRAFEVTGATTPQWPDPWPNREAPEEAWTNIQDGATAPTEDVVAEGLEADKVAIGELIDFQNEFVASVGVGRKPWEPKPMFSEEVYDAVAAFAWDRMGAALVKGKAERDANLDELKTQLRAGKSLAQIAKDKGVDRQKLIDALVKAAQDELDKLKADLPDRIAKLVDQTPPTGGDHGPGGPGFGGPGLGGRHGGAGLDAAAKAIGVTVDDLRTQLQGGKTIAQVAKAKGVDEQKVIDAMVADAKSHLDQAVKDGHLTQAQADKELAEAKTRIKDLVENGFAKGGPGMGGPGMGGPGGGRGWAPGGSPAPGN